MCVERYPCFDWREIYKLRVLFCHDDSEVAAWGWSEDVRILSQEATPTFTMRKRRSKILLASLRFGSLEHGWEELYSIEFSLFSHLHPFTHMIRKHEAMNN